MCKLARKKKYKRGYKGSVTLDVEVEIAIVGGNKQRQDRAQSLLSLLYEHGMTQQACQVYPAWSTLINRPCVAGAVL